MSKAEGRQGNSSLPPGQTKIGYGADTAGNPKTGSSFMSIPTPSDGGVVTGVGAAPMNSSSAGFPNEDSRNVVKGGPDTTPNPDVVNRSYSYIDDGQMPAIGGGITLTNANRLKEGIQPGTAQEPVNGIPGYDQSGNGGGTGTSAD